MSSVPDYLSILSASRIRGTVVVPGDKSISHRAIILASLADGTSRLTGFLSGEHCLATLRAMQALGAAIEQRSETEVIVEGTGGLLHPTLSPIDCGSSPTALRLLTGILSAQSFTSQLFADNVLANTQMDHVAEALRTLGAHVKGMGDRCVPPLEIVGSSLVATSFTLPDEHAHAIDVKSAFLLAALFAKGTTSLIEKTPLPDHTEHLLTHFHACIALEETDEVKTIRLRGGTKLHANDFHIPGDISSAAPWLIAAAASPNSEIIVNEIGLNPTRTGIINVLLRMGAKIQEVVADPHTEPTGTLNVRGTTLRATKIPYAQLTQILNELPIITVLAALAEGDTEIEHNGKLSTRDHDRLAAMLTNLRAFNVLATELEDRLVIHGKAKIKRADVDSFGDHRIAIASAILALFAFGESTINNTACIANSYPSFKADLDKLVVREEPPATGISGFFGLSR